MKIQKQKMSNAQTMNKNNKIKTTITIFKIQHFPQNNIFGIVVHKKNGLFILLILQLCLVVLLKKEEEEENKNKMKMRMTMMILIMKIPSITSFKLAVKEVSHRLKQ